VVGAGEFEPDLEDATLELRPLELGHAGVDADLVARGQAR
jgi:hypothetical protein